MPSCVGLVLRASTDGRRVRGRGHGGSSGGAGWPPQQLSLLPGAELRGGGGRKLGEGSGRSSGAGEVVGARGRVRRRGCDSGDSSKDFRVFPPLGAVTLFVLSPHLGNISYQGDPQHKAMPGSRSSSAQTPGVCLAEPWVDVGLPAMSLGRGSPGRREPGRGTSSVAGRGKLSCLSGAPAHWHLSGSPRLDCSSGAPSVPTLSETPTPGQLCEPAMSHAARRAGGSGEGTGLYAFKEPSEDTTCRLSGCESPWCPTV